MPRGLKRYQQAGDLHFITFSCYQRRPYLNHDFGRILFEENLEILRKRHRFSVFGYVLMPEHVHLLLSEPEVGHLWSSLKVLKSETSKRLKKGREHFWQLRYYDFNVLTRDKLVEKLKYMHRNPVTRGLVERPEDWPWSSFLAYSTGKQGRVEIDFSWMGNLEMGPFIAKAR